MLIDRVAPPQCPSLVSFFLPSGSSNTKKAGPFQSPKTQDMDESNVSQNEGESTWVKQFGYFSVY